MTRSTYMQNLMTLTYPTIAIEAIKNGFDGAWERLIAERLRKDYRADHSQAVVLVDSQPIDDNVPEELQLFHKSIKAAHLITSSTIQTHEQTT